MWRSLKLHAKFAEWAKFDPFILLPAFASVLLAGLWMTVWFQIKEERQLARHETLAKSQALAHTFAEFGLHELQQVDHASQLFKLRYEESAGRLTVAGFMRKEGGLNSVLPSDIDVNLILIDADGRQIDGSQPFATTSVAGEVWFKDIASHPSEALVISKPFRHAGAADGSSANNRGHARPWLIRFARRLQGGSGKFAGVIVLELDPAQFVDHFDSRDLGQLGAVLLFSPAEKLSVRRVGEQFVASDDLDFSGSGMVDAVTKPFAGSNMDGNTSATIEQWQLQSPFDGVNRLFVARPLAEFGLVALVGLTEDEALLRYQRHRNSYLAGAVLITLLILFFILLLMRQGRHLQAAIRQTREGEARLRTIANTLPAMVAYIDADQRYRFHNLAYGRSISPDSEHVLGKTVREVVGEERYRIFQPYIRRVLAGESLVYQQETRENGEYRCLESNYIPQFAVDGKQVVGFHVMRQDITDKKLEEMRLLQLAQFDTLTGLCNRAGFELRLHDAMKRSRESHGLLGLLFLDVDHFKQVNDLHGHAVGDALLRAFAQRLAQVFRASDTVARLGGDEFTVIMENLQSRDDALTLAGKVISAMQDVFVLGPLALSVSASAGLAFYAGEGQSADELISAADMLLYDAKRGGRNRFAVSEAGGS